MKKFINKTEDITKELLEGYVLAYPDQVKLGGETGSGKYRCAG